MIHLGWNSLTTLAKQCFGYTNTANYKKKKVLQTGRRGFFATYSFNQATCVACRFLALKTEHSRIHIMSILVYVDAKIQSAIGGKRNISYGCACLSCKYVYEQTIRV